MTDNQSLTNGTAAKKNCPYCGEEILTAAQKCKHCGEFLDEKLRQERNTVAQTIVQPVKIPKWSGGIAAVLSLIIPGLGQIYKGQIINGLFWLVLVACGYFFLIIPGLVLHFLCILGAASGDPYE
jgi:TM2 domain-containing membrane protein YozV